MLPQTNQFYLFLNNEKLSEIMLKEETIMLHVVHLPRVGHRVWMKLAVPLAVSDNGLLG